jgi:biotin-dependent carboxylase-like uncharacterized protein
MSWLEVVRPGLLTTVQDLGRPGLGRFGVSPAGAMDPLALTGANALVGNARGAPALELTGPGAAFRFHGAATVAIGGADLDPRLDATPFGPWRAVPAGDGALLTFEARRRGARAILAVAGGLVAPLALGSASADLDAGLGSGRLARGQRLEIGPARGVPAPPPPLDAYDDPFCLGFVPDQDPAVTAACAALFLATEWRVSDRSNRTGYRLTGPPLPVLPAADRLSEPVAPGLIQLPPDGTPILLMADRQTTGGYPRLGFLSAADRPKAAQLWPGDRIRFVLRSQTDGTSGY